MSTQWRGFARLTKRSTRVAFEGWRICGLHCHSRQSKLWLWKGLTSTSSQMLPKTSAVFLVISREYIVHFFFLPSGWRPSGQIRLHFVAALKGDSMSRRQRQADKHGHLTDGIVLSMSLQPLSTICYWLKFPFFLHTTLVSIKKVVKKVGKKCHWFMKFDKKKYRSIFNRSDVICSSS